MRIRAFVLAAGLCLPAVSAAAQVDARMFRYPDVSATHFTFVYAGDIWVVPKEGGTALRLSSPRGEESFPRFSPDGSRIAFSGNYDGNTDVYVVPAMGGEPTRVTHHPMGDRFLDWHPDGEHLLFASSRESGRQRYSQFFQVPATGGLPSKLPIPYGEFGTLSDDGNLLAYTPKSRDFRTWKRYRGGWAPEVWVFDLTDSTAVNITNNDANDAQPMWHGDTIYFLSDRGPAQRHNIWAYERGDGSLRQVTQFTDFDIAFPAIGPTDLVFQAGGRLYLMDLADESTREVDVGVVTDLATLKPRTETVADLIFSGHVSPTGKRAVLEARGDIFTLPAEHGPVMNVTNTSGVAERYPTWSPDAKHIAYWSDASGEYELYVRPTDGSGAARKLTSLGAGFRYAASWSPDSEKLAFWDELGQLRVLNIESGQLTQIDQSPVWMNHGALLGNRLNWSSDGRWLTFARPLVNRNSAVFLYDTEASQLTQATSGYYTDFQPVFDPDGKYLFFYTNRELSPVYSDFDNSWSYPNATRIAAVALRPDVPSPLAPRNDMEDAEEENGSGDGENGDDDNGQEEEEAAVEIVLAGFEQRAVILPPEPGNVGALSAVSGKVIFHDAPRSGSGDDEAPIRYYDLEERETKTIIGDANNYALTHDGKKMLVRANGQLAIIDVKPDQKFEKPLRTGDMEVTVDPRAEWRQMFADVWRFERDFFYDEGMHGVDWDAMREQYGPLIADAVTRWDLNFVIGELIAELNASHAYRGGGDQESAPTRRVGMLGVDWSLENGAYRIAHIVDGAPWDAEVRSPLRQPGVDVNEGDYVLAVNGVPVDTSKDPWAAFQGLVDNPVMLTVNSSPSMEGARQVLVEPLGSENRLRHLEWIEANRKRVEEATDGRVGYVYVRSTGIDAQNELVRQFAAQFTKDGLIIDERWNSGGQIPDRFIELLNRPLLSYWAARFGDQQQWPPIAHRGPKVMLINGWSGSGGDAFPYYFREAGVGPLIGARTWGGLIGISGAPGLVDGGVATVPTFRMYSTDGEWFEEGVGVAPDIPVAEDPGQLARGVDTQLERAIEETLRLIEQNLPTPAPRPSAERRVAGDGGR
jgi:tricorn protease